MNVSTVELRYKTKEVLAAVARGEQVVIVSRGKEKGVISRRQRVLPRVTAHPFFGSIAKGKAKDVAALMNELRGGRFGAL